MWPYPWTHVGTPSHLGHMDRVAATMPSQAHAGAAQEAPDRGQWEGQDVPLVRPSSCNVKGGIPSSRRYLPTYLPRSCKPGDIRDRGLYSTLPIPHCANSVLYLDYTELPKFRGYDFALVVTCGLTSSTRVFPCTKHITGEETMKILLEEWFCVYGAPIEI